MKIYFISFGNEILNDDEITIIYLLSLFINIIVIYKLR